jgi:hypothetical protein
MGSTETTEPPTSEVGQPRRGAHQGHREKQWDGGEGSPDDDGDDAGCPQDAQCRRYVAAGHDENLDDQERRHQDGNQYLVFGKLLDGLPCAADRRRDLVTRDIGQACGPVGWMSATYRSA